MASSDYDLLKSMFEDDPKLYEYTDGFWMFSGTFPREVIDAARVVQFKDSDILTATFPKTGKKATSSCYGLALS